MSFANSDNWGGGFHLLSPYGFLIIVAEEPCEAQEQYGRDR